MRRNIYLLISLVFLLSSCSKDNSSSDEPISTEKFDSSQLVGSWYEETMNEEIRFNQNGTYYDRYSCVLRSGEIEGRWECNPEGKQLVYRYFYMGQTQEDTWTIKSINQSSFVIGNNYAYLVLEPIVESYVLKVGQTIDLHSGTYGAIYSSKNERIVSVKDGCLRAEGEKGTTYVKVQTGDVNSWIKVTVGDNCPDLWWDYVSLLMCDYNTMWNTLKPLGEPLLGDDGYSFGFKTLDDVVKEVDVLLCSEESLVTEIGLLIKESVPESTILSYLKAHYYPISQNKEFAFYSSSEIPDESKAIIGYDKSNRVVWIFEMEHFLYNPHEEDILGSYYEDLGLTTKDIISKYGTPVSQTGNVILYIIGTEYIDYAGFYIDENTDRCILSSIFINENISVSAIVSHLNSLYTIYENGTTSDGSQYAWINGKSFANSTFGIIYHPEDNMVSYQMLNNQSSKSRMTKEEFSFKNDLIQTILNIIKP